MGGATWLFVINDVCPLIKHVANSVTLANSELQENMTVSIVANFSLIPSQNQVSAERCASVEISTISWSSFSMT